MEALDFLIKYLKSEYQNGCEEFSNLDAFREFRSLVNIRPPAPIGKEFLAVQDEFLQKLTAEKGVTDLTSLSPAEPNIYLWQGDITTLQCGGIVNAANSGLTGCYGPCHACIDNAIHTFAGVQLRLECAGLMRKQGFPEPTGKAKITKAYNLPCDYVIHTVGPIVAGTLTQKHRDQLAGCYQSCLELAVQNKLDSIAFCCISTGEFHFPNQKAAEIAVRTVREFLKQNRQIKIILNVFKDKDYAIYQKLLG